MSFEEVFTPEMMTALNRDTLHLEILLVKLGEDPVYLEGAKMVKLFPDEKEKIMTYKDCVYRMCDVFDYYYSLYSDKYE